jgi:uncharacterized protein YlxW (UPF0749 family)
VGVLSGALLAVSAINSDGTDLRAGRFTDLASLVQDEKVQTNALNARVSRLNAEIDTLSGRVGDRAVSRYQDEIADLQDPAGLTPVSGEAVKVTLTDASREVVAAAEETNPEVNPNDYVVHQQDIQAVANAMWRAGAEAVTIQGQRLITTTGIKCHGNTVTLHGVPYAPPYEIVAIGEQRDLLGVLEDDHYLQIYRAYASAPGGGVGWDLQRLGHHTAPAFDGVLDMDYAEPITG